MIRKVLIFYLESDNAKKKEKYIQPILHHQQSGEGPDARKSTIYDITFDWGPIK